MVGAQGSEIYGKLLGDEAIAGQFADAAHLRALLDVEAALARAQGRLGTIPADAAAAIDKAARELTLDPDELADSTYDAGLPVIALVVKLRDAVGGEAAQYVIGGDQPGHSGYRVGTSVQNGPARSRGPTQQYCWWACHTGPNAP